jgi:GDPmannose 4,6-dehydratase
LLIGDPTKSKTKLGWVPQYDLAGLVKEMMEGDLAYYQKKKMLREAGFSVEN